jgi:bifunctional non-homologous end joining protein LigD
MRQPKNDRNKKGKEINKIERSKTSLKNLSVNTYQKSVDTTNSKEDIYIDIKLPKNYKTAVDFAKRKLKNSPVLPMPEALRPMLATLTDEAFNNEDWQFEIKWDGYRALSFMNKGKVDIKSRNGNSFNTKFLSVHKALYQWNVNAIIDGEIVALNDKGLSDFGKLQQWQKSGEGNLVYFVFDLLWLDGINMMEKPLTERREILRKITPDEGLIRYSDSIEEYGMDFFEAAKRAGLEGIIAKKKDSPYVPDSRSKTWLKIKAEERHEAIICGYTKNRDTARLFSSLVLGIYENGKLKFIGQVGTGFDGATQRSIFKKLNPLFTKQCPFEEAPDTKAPTLWIKPQIVCEVKYTELTEDGLMRHPSFQGLREDKTALDLNVEKPCPVPAK